MKCRKIGYVLLIVVGLGLPAGFSAASRVWPDVVDRGDLGNIMSMYFGTLTCLLLGLYCLLTSD